jgi:hypothetical protein
MPIQLVVPREVALLWVVIVFIRETGNMQLHNLADRNDPDGSDVTLS